MCIVDHSFTYISTSISLNIHLCLYLSLSELSSLSISLPLSFHFHLPSWSMCASILDVGPIIQAARSPRIRFQLLVCVSAKDFLCKTTSRILSICRFQSVPNQKGANLKCTKSEPILLHVNCLSPVFRTSGESRGTLVAKKNDNRSSTNHLLVDSNVLLATVNTSLPTLPNFQTI